MSKTINKYHKYLAKRKKINFIHLDVSDKADIIINNSSKAIKVALIVAHRNHIEHLKKFNLHFNQLLESEDMNIKIDIFLIDQNNGDKFNCGLMRNVGYLISKKYGDYDRVIFHNIDILPDKVMFKKYFTHLDLNMHFASPYLGNKYSSPEFFGGVIGFSKTDFEKINGYPNNFFGLGGEDESLYNRTANLELKCARPSSGSFKMLDNDKPTKYDYNDKKRNNILEDLTKFQSNGLKQLMNIFLNIKKVKSYNDFIEQYNLPDSNIYNGSENIQDFLKSDQTNSVISDSVISDSVISDPTDSDPTDSDPTNTISTKLNYYIFKIDYLALHSIYFDRLLETSFVDEKIRIKLKKFEGKTVYQHRKYKQIISNIEPLVEWKEIETKIINTYTPIKKFKDQTNSDQTNSDQTKVKVINLVKNYFKDYKVVTKDDLINTLKLVHDTYNEILFFRIRNSKLECSYHIYNIKSNYDWLKYIKHVDSNTNIHKLDEVLIKIIESKGSDYYTLRKPHNLQTNNCLLGLDSYSYFEGNPMGYVEGFIDMLNYTLKKFKNIPDCDILINRRDFSYFNKDGSLAYDHLIPKSENISKINKLYFIGTQSVKSHNFDIPIPSSDEWYDIDKYDLLKDRIDSIKWSDKLDIAFFRGSSTGCGINIKNNARLKLANFSYRTNKIDTKRKIKIDAGISTLIGRIKVYESFIGIYNRKEHEYLKGSFVDINQQLKYKYIFNVEGNVQAYRYPNELKRKSLILSIETDYKMWFEPLLTESKEYISIDRNLTNLVDKLEYLENNDNKAEEIALNSYNFANTYITKDMISFYWFQYMLNINKLSE
jgi:hypothetical protein